MSQARDRRIRTAFVFSALCLIVAVVASRAFDVRLNPDEGDRALAMLVPSLGLALASMFASMMLVAALLERRPVLRDRKGRWLWAWTLAFCAAYLMFGLANSASSTPGQVLMYASGLFVGLAGSIGLVLSVFPRRISRSMRA